MIVVISVFSLFHPVELQVQPARSSIVVVEQKGRRQTLEGSGSIRLRSAATVTGRDGADARFVLSVPGEVSREFHGRLEIREQHGELLAIVRMDRENAVASIVAAESPPGAPLEARKAQAVVARSFLIAAHGRHDGFDFCDTTHCQFLRDAPAAGSLSARAAEQTRDLIVAYQGHAIEALYSANCGGKTRTLEEADGRLRGIPISRSSARCAARWLGIASGCARRARRSWPGMEKPSGKSSRYIFQRRP
jgi:peptidoglycan hydrolase-like amidase